MQQNYLRQLKNNDRIFNSFNLFGYATELLLFRTIAVVGISGKSISSSADAGMKSGNR